MSSRVFDNLDWHCCVFYSVFEEINFTQNVALKLARTPPTILICVPAYPDMFTVCCHLRTEGHHHGLLNSQT